MESGNTSSDFILLGLLGHSRAQQFLFGMVLTIAFTALVGNALMILLIQWDLRLHTSMYFLLSQLSLMDAMLVSTTVPKMAADYLTGNKSISPAGCGLQIFFLLTLGGGEYFLFAAMSYDRNVAVCHPLRYPMLMSWPLCLRMTMGSWFLGAADRLMQAVVSLGFPFCSRREIDHFFSDERESGITGAGTQDCPSGKTRCVDSRVAPVPLRAAGPVPSWRGTSCSDRLTLGMEGLVLQVIVSGGRPLLSGLGEEVVGIGSSD
ncbi:olfactory receptor 2T33-like [Callospermophilus lateralis]|uniref:olfactory receptor 2T33-like n=1 Tax=Callospermophilus lateralis TaxID=76772 RepID=UPI004053A9AB